MENLKFEQVEISGVLDKDGECGIWTDGCAFLNKVEIQQVISHLKLLLKV